MGFPFDFIDENDMTELINSNNKVTLLQRTGGFGSDAPTLTLAVNSPTLGVANTGGEIYSPQPLIASVGVALGGSVIDLELVKGGSDMPRPAQASFTVQGDILVNASVRNGMELIHRNIAQDRNPTAEYAGGGSFPGEHEVVAAEALAGASDADKVTADFTIVAIPAGIEYEVEPTVGTDIRITCAEIGCLGRRCYNHRRRSQRCRDQASRKIQRNTCVGRCQKRWGLFQDDHRGRIYGLYNRDGRQSDG